MLALLTPHADGYIPHAPIRIVGNADFTPANGVTGGSGTPADPYVIEGWEVDASSATGLEVRNTDVPFVIRKVSVHSGGENHAGITLVNVTGGRVEDSLSIDNSEGIVVSASTSVQLVANHAAGNRMNGITVQSSEAVVVTANNVTSNAWTGLFVSVSTNLTLAANNVSQNNGGVYLSEVDNATLDVNRVLLNAQGVHLASSLRVTLRGNLFTGNGVILSGRSTFGQPPDISFFDTHRMDPDNLVNGLPLRYHRGAAGLSLDGVPTGQLIVVNSTDVRVSNVDLQDSEFALQMYFVQDANVSTSNISLNRGLGVHVAWCSGVVFYSNFVFGNSGSGIEVRGCSDVAILSNVVSGNSGRGVYVDDIAHGTVAGNIATSNGVDGLYVGSSTDAALTGNEASDNGLSGIDLSGSRNSSATGNRVEGNVGYGIVLFDTANVTLAANTISSNAAWGVGIESSIRASLEGNTLSRDGVFVRGDAPQHFNTHDIRLDNVVNGLPVLYARDCGGLVVDGQSLGQLIVANCTDLRAGRMTFAEADVGIQLYYVEGAHIHDVTVSAGAHGIVVAFSHDVTLSEVNASGNTRDGMTVGSASGVRLSAYSATRNAGGGLVLSEVSDAIVVGGDVAENAVGIALIRAANVTVVSNEVRGNADAGLALSASDAVALYRNVLSENGVQALDDRGGVNAWDAGYPGGGNFWSDYAGVDICRGVDQQDCSGPDGIGDTPYAIDSDSGDRYPLMLVENTAPIASLVVTPAAGDTETSFAFDASGSTDGEVSTTLLMVRWDWEGDGAWDTDWSFEKVVQHRFDASGSYAVRVEVRDPEGMTGRSSVPVDVRTPFFPAVVGIAAFLLIVLVAAVVADFLRRRRRGPRSEEKTPDEPGDDAPREDSAG